MIRELVLEHSCQTLHRLFTNSKDQGMESYKVICADDDPHICTFFEKLLGARHHQVRTLPDGTGVINSFEREPADIIFLDIDMPIMSGLEICHQIRLHPTACNVPIIICSSYESEEMIVAAFSSGADDYIIKPAKPAEVFAKMVTAIRKRSEPITSQSGIAPGNLVAGKYQIKDKLGSGGFSRVYKAIDISNTPPIEVAVKFFDSNVWSKFTPNYLAIFLREAYALSKLKHPNIVKFHDFGRSQTHHYLAMEYVCGKTLGQTLEENGPMSEKQVVNIGAEMIKLLRYLRERNIVHRDISPHNIMLLESNQIKVVDFGMAKPTQDFSMTPKDLFTGSPIYASPEQIMNYNVDPSGDIFSLGATLYNLCSNKSPYPGETYMDIFSYRMKYEPIPVQQVAPSLSSPVAMIIDRMMSLQKQDRPNLEAIEAVFLSDWS